LTDTLYLAPMPCKDLRTIFVISMPEQRELCQSRLRFIVGHCEGYIVS